MSDGPPKEEVTVGDIEALMSNAEEFGDEPQLQMCIAALSGNKSARTTCEKLIRDARSAAGLPFLKELARPPDRTEAALNLEGSPS